MSSIYPSLEDMKATELIRAQAEAFRPTEPANTQQPQYTMEPGHYPTLSPSAPSSHGAVTSMAYPRLHEFMGLELTEQVIRENMPEYLEQAVAVPAPSAVTRASSTPSATNVIAPISGSALAKSIITHGVRQCEMTKENGKLGLRVRAMHTGVFVCLVIDGSPASKVGIRFGDQILQINGIDVVGLSVDKVHGTFKDKNLKVFTLAVRDRPFERTVTLVRDSHRHIGFQFKNGKIINIVKDSSAARNGLLTEHTLLEINGRNVIGVKDKEITKVLDSIDGNALNITIMPTFLYQHMVKEMDKSLFGKMDHSDQDF